MIAVEGFAVQENNQPLVSVIMNCFNGEKYLREAIDSVLAQSYQNWEIVFWDNQSSDGSAQIVQSYADPRIKYFYAPMHTWLYEARNYAIEKANGEFFAFLDVDDWWMPEKLEKQVPLFQDAEVGMVCANYWAVSEKKNRKWLMFERPIPTGWVLSDLLKFYFPGLLTLMIRRFAFEGLSHGCDPRYHIIGDFDLVVRLSIHWKMGCVQKPLACYRLHGNNETAKHTRRHVAETATWMSEMGNVDVIRQSPGWKQLGTNHTYLNALDQVLSGNRRAGRQLLRDLPWSKLKLRLLVILCLPISVVQKIKN
jgi:glycosyltransferase involved in cell wall biosynthesis